MIPWMLAGLLLAGMSPAPRGVVVITVDTLRADHLGFLGGRGVETGSLDRLSRRGTSFLAAHSASPSTAPAHASMFTGLYPSFHGIGRFNGRYRLSEATPTLARTLQQKGIATAAVVSNPVLGHGLGLNQGFDRYDDRFEGRELNRDHRERTAGVAVARALAELELLLGEPRFLLWLHLQDPHGPYTPPEPFLSPEEVVASDTLKVGADHTGDRSIPRYQVLGDERRIGVYRARYRAEIAYLDRELKVLLDRLESDERLAGTLVVFTADHGEALGEDGYYFAHGHSAGAELLRVPLVLAGPEIESDQRIPGAVSTVSLFATVLEYFGLPVAGAVQAESLFGLLRQAAPAGERPVFGESHNQIAVARGEAWLRRDREETRRGGFFDLPHPDGIGSWRPLPRTFVGADSGEERQLDALLREFELESQRADGEWMARRIAQVGLSGDGEIERLRALGYIR